ncbi:Mth938-like domain-containing protein [Rhizobium sp. C4]|uniref:Mth938-like domain-containing protein n=1 Tax=Rhizobium sp. C4 TaxID=1349800 RepID=UPI001E2AF33B|nr:MTH938/NDUFAF3 family protein [Rhizobium sp. C4]MCD2175195.1 MTH938/NDUFAF3 family protein [Rhizobium sp. C4]
MSRTEGPGFLPEQVQMDVYGNGGFRFADMSHRGSILCLPSGIHAWTAVEGTPLRPEDFDKVIAEAERIEFLLVGTGRDIRPLSAELKTLFRAHGMNSDPMSTGAAVRTYNIMLSENRPVAAAFIAV